MKPLSKITALTLAVVGTVHPGLALLVVSAVTFAVVLVFGWELVVNSA